MEYKLIIPGTLPNLNDLIHGERQQIRKCGKFTTVGNTMKQESQELIIWQIRQQLKGIHINHPVRLKYLFFEPNKKRDKDNISAFAHKVTQDALVVSNVLENDGWKNVVGYTDDFAVDKDNPRIEVTIQEVE